MPDLPAAQNPLDTPIAPSGSGQQEVVPQPITPAQFTPEQIAALIPVIQEHSQRIAQETANNAFRGMQRTVNKLEQSVTARMKELADIGIVPTPEQKELIRENMKKQIENEVEAAGSQPTQNLDQAQQVDPLVADAEDIFRDVGVRLEQGDPEIAMVNQSTRAKFLITLNEAAVAKKNRLARAAQINNPNNVPSAGQRTGQPNSISEINDIDELYARARRK